MDSKDLGTLSICALRYCLGRRSAFPSDVIKIVCTHWESIDDKAKVIIKRDLDDAIASRDLGDDCDSTKWQNFKKWIDEGCIPKHPEAIKYGIELATAQTQNNGN